MKIKTIAVLMTTLTMASAANASVHCDDPGLYFWGYTGMPQPVPMIVHCNITNDTNTTHNYHVHTKGLIGNRYNGSTIAMAESDYNITLNPGESKTDNYTTTVMVGYPQMGEFACMYQMNVSDGESYEHKWYGNISVPR